MSALSNETINLGEAMMAYGFGVALAEADVANEPGGPATARVPIIAIQFGGRPANSEAEVTRTILLSYEDTAELVARLVVDVGSTDRVFAHLLSMAVADREKALDNPSPLDSDDAADGY